MANQYTNKVVFGSETLIDLTSDTVTAADVAQGKTFHLPTGEPAVGTASGTVTIVDTPDSHGGTIREITAEAFTKATLNVSENGTYTAPAGTLYNTVEVNVSGGGGGLVLTGTTTTLGSGTFVPATDLPANTRLDLGVTLAQMRQYPIIKLVFFYESNSNLSYLYLRLNKSGSANVIRRNLKGGSILMMEWIDVDHTFLRLAFWDGNPSLINNRTKTNIFYTSEDGSENGPMQLVNMYYDTSNIDESATLMFDSFSTQTLTGTATWNVLGGS